MNRERISRAQRRLRTVPDPRTRSDLRRVASWWALEARRGLPSSAQSFRYAVEMMRRSVTAPHHGYPSPVSYWRRGVRESFRPALIAMQKEAAKAVRRRRLGRREAPDVEDVHQRPRGRWEVTAALTDRQREVLAFIAWHQATHGAPPTFREIGRHFGFSFTAASGHVAALERKGAVRRERGRSRSIVPTGTTLDPSRDMLRRALEALDEGHEPWATRRLREDIRRELDS